MRIGQVGFALAMLGAALSSPAVRAQGRLADARPGSVTERIVSASDTAEAYAVFLPPGYTPQRDWPVLFVMDPRGQAMAALRLFRPAAERMGWIVVSSYNTASDVKVSPNAQAMQAMLADVQRDLAPDLRRMYLAGFSGTAREAWYFGFRLPDNVAGLLNFGAGLPDESPFLRMRAGETPKFVVFQGMGDLDFNYDEVRTLDQRLDNTPIAHRLVQYAGPHDWCPPAVCDEAVEWMELQAVKRGLAQRSDAWRDSLLAEAEARAAARDSAGDHLGALMRYRAVVDDFGDRPGVAPARQRLAVLEADRTVRADMQRYTRQAQRDSVVRRHHYAVFDAMNQALRPPALARLVADVGVDELKRDAARTDDTLVSLAARRHIADVLAFTTFYGPRSYMEKGDSARTLLLLGVARALRPQSPGICYSFAAAYARFADADRAFAELECLVRAAVDPAAVQNAPELEPLHADPRFAAFMDRLRAARAARAAAPAS